MIVITYYDCQGSRDPISHLAPNSRTTTRGELRSELRYV